MYVACQVCDLVLGKVPGSQVVTDVGAELSFILPSTATHHFPALFDSLESQTCTIQTQLLTCTLYMYMPTLYAHGHMCLYNVTASGKR